MNESQLQNLSDKEFCSYVEPDSAIAREAIRRLSTNPEIDGDQIESLESALSESEDQVGGLESELEIAIENIKWVIDELTEVIDKKPGVNAVSKASEIIDELKDSV
jgi:hypothetical protein